jgi:hypothetical protein
MDLNTFKDPNVYNKKGKALELLKLDKFNKVAINYLLRLYSKSNQPDSIKSLYENLIINNPLSPEPYLIRNQLYKYESLTDSDRINFLKKAREIDSLNIEANYELGIQFYQLFIKEYTEDKNIQNLDYYSKKSLFYFSYLCSINQKFKETLVFPLLQLSKYLKDNDKYSQFKTYHKQSSYFPVSSFLSLPDDWETNYAVDVISFTSNLNTRGIESAVFHIAWYAKHLLALQEPILSDSLPTKIFRFTWLRTFHNPIVIGVENNNDIVTIYYKVCDGAGGYEPGKLVKNKTKIITITDWNNLVDKTKAIDFWNIPSTEYKNWGVDGAQWILEGKQLGKYNVVDRWSGGEISPVCLFMLKLTDLKIKKADIY